MAAAMSERDCKEEEHCLFTVLYAVSIGNLYANISVYQSNRKGESTDPA